jgi:hypothetical protein
VDLMRNRRQIRVSLCVLLGAWACGWGSVGAIPAAFAQQATGKGQVNLEEGKEVFRPRKNTPAGGVEEQADSAWTITLASFRGDGHEALAASALEKIRAQPTLRDAFILQRGTATLIAIGRFADPTSPETTAELKRIRELVIEGGRPFAQAVLTPPTGGTKLGSRPEYNLLSARAQFGKKSAVTLQVGVYGRDDLAKPTEADLKEVREQAEQAAAQLRREGELAFYYHGPSRSMVTVGVFTEEDAGDPVRKLPESRELTALRKRFPYNLYNGAGLREKRPGDKEPRMQTSMPVRIPEK